MIENQIITTIYNITGIPVDEITIDSHLYDELDVDSLDMAQIVLALENHYQVDISDDAVARLKTVRDLINLLSQLTTPLMTASI